MNAKTKSSRDNLLLWDCDPGCDDALAMAYLLRPAECPYQRLDFLTVSGNVHVEQTTANTRRVLAVCRAAWPKPAGEFPQCRVFRGAAYSLTGEEPLAASVHGRDGLGGVPNNLPGCEVDGAALPEVEPTSAIERYLEVAREGQKFDLLCTGPLTNLAVALTTMDRPTLFRFWKSCRRAVIMGGSFGGSGNITPSAEFNFHADPVAVQMVLTHVKGVQANFDKGNRRCQLHFVPLDVTEKVGLHLDVQVCRAGGTAPGRFLRYALKEYGTFHAFSAVRPETCGRFDPVAYVKAQLLGSSGVSELKRFCHLHDPVAAWVLARMGKADDGVSWDKMPIRVDQRHGESRGRVIDCSAKEGLPFPQAELGTLVWWLKPTVHNLKLVEGSLVPALQELLGFEKEASRL